MSFARNQFGVPQYPEHDVRRLFVLLSAIDLLERPTLSAIADLTGHDKGRIDADTIRLREELGVVLHKVGEIYMIESWGEVLNKDGVTRFLKG